MGERTGLLAFGAALSLAAVDIRLATIPLALFLMCSFLAPFFPWTGFFFPVISRGNTKAPMVALTFDDGPDPVTTPMLLDLLSIYRVPATFFVTGRRVQAYPHLVRQIIEHGHTIGNHSYHHEQYRMYLLPSVLMREITDTQEILARSGVVPVAFRPPVGVTTPAMGAVLDEKGMITVNFSCRAFDWGNRHIHRLANKILSKIQGDDIVMLHDSLPSDPAHLDRWIREVRKILAGISKKGFTVVPLETLIGRPVMKKNVVPQEKGESTIFGTAVSTPKPESR